MSQVKVAGLVLAGGRSTRMGQDKARMLLDGLTLLERTRQCMMAANTDKVWVAGPQSGGQPDLRPGQGPAVALLDWMKAPERRQFDYCVVMPVDMPLVTPELLNTLILTAMRTEGACYYRRHHLPAVFPISQTLMDRAETCLEQAGKLSIGRLLNLGHVTELEPDPHELSELVNINHPQDWEDLVGKRGP